MGQLGSYIRDEIIFKKELYVYIFGLRKSGKTTVLHKLKVGEQAEETPTFLYSCETIKHKSIYFHLIDTEWISYNNLNHAVIFVVSSSYNSYFYEERYELNRWINNHLFRNSPILVLANKQDFPNAISPEEVAHRLGMYDLMDRKWFVCGTCGLTGEGLYEGLDWLARNLS